MEKNLWCQGLPFEKRRALSGDEAAALKTEIDSALRRARWGVRLAIVGFAIAGIGIAASIALGFSADENHLGPVAAAFGLGIAVPAALGALQEIFAARSRRSRAVFAAAIVICAGASAADSGASHEWLEIPALLGFFVAFFGGWAMLIVRWRDDGALLPAFQAAAADALAGEVLRFDSRAPAPGTPGSIEVLPNSRLAYRVRDQRPPDWEVQYVAELSQGAGAPEAPLHAAVPQDGREYHQRHLSEGERAELDAHCARLPKRAFLRAAAYAYGAALFLRFVQTLLSGQFQAALSPLGFGLAFAAGAWVLFTELSLWRRLRRDIANGLLVVIREPAADAAKPTTLLPESGLIWENQGVPSPWRTFKWW